MKIGDWMIFRRSIWEKTLAMVKDMQTDMALLRAKVEEGRRTRVGTKHFLEALEGLRLLPDEVKYRLGKLDDNDPVYEAVMKVMHKQAEIELDMLLPPGRTNEERQYGAGRAAAVADMMAMLEGIRQEGRRLIERNAA